MRTYLIPMYSDVSAPGIREENMSEVKQRIQLSPGEHIVLYYDDGLFSHGKTGFILTDKRIFMIEKKNNKGETIHLCTNENCRFKKVVAVSGEEDNE